MTAIAMRGELFDDHSSLNLALVEEGPAGVCATAWRRYPVAERQVRQVRQVRQGVQKVSGSQQRPWKRCN